jgi:hypothetical protein
MCAQGRALDAARQKSKRKNCSENTSILQDLNVGQQHCESFLQVGSQGSGQ